MPRSPGVDGIQDPTYPSDLKESFVTGRVWTSKVELIFPESIVPGTGSYEKLPEKSQEQCRSETGGGRGEQDE